MSPDLVVAGAGMAGLVAAARARELGTVLPPRGRRRARRAMRFSSGCSGATPPGRPSGASARTATRRSSGALFERLDADLDWLEARGARVTGADREPRAPWVAASTGLDRRGARRASSSCAAPLDALPPDVPVVLATGGFAASRELLREHVTAEADALLLRARRTRRATGCGSGSPPARGTSAGMGEIYGRAMPAAPLAPERWITDAQLYARHATVTDEAGERYEARTWSEIDVVQWLARRPGARGWLVVAPDKLGEPTPYGSVAEQVARAEAAGAEVRRADRHGLGARRRRP